MIFIMNFNNSRELSDIKESFDNDEATNIDFLMEGFAEGKRRWFVPKNANLEDIIVFMCAKEARHNLGMATSHIPDDYSDEFRAFVDEQKALYKKYSGHILGYGIVATEPEEDDGWWMSEIDRLCRFENPIYIDEFRSFISISKTNSITYITEDQWKRLKGVIKQKNPEIFTDEILPDMMTIKREYEEALKEALSKPMEQLRKEAEAKSSHASISMVQTKVYHRDPTIAAYVKKRANGYCQLCGLEAPFSDKDGVPYLECHHIDWLSKTGEDSIDNCVALCPNCHRKMHFLNKKEDIKKLKSVIDQDKDVRSAK